MGFPTEQKNRSDAGYFNENEAIFAQLYKNNLMPSGGSFAGTTGVPWKTATPPTVTANTWTRAGDGSAMIAPLCGKKVVVRSITVDVSAACQIAIFIAPALKTTAPYFILDSAIQGISKVGAGQFYIKDCPAAGTYKWDFGSSPTVIKHNYNCHLYTAVSGTSGVNWQFVSETWELADDDNFSAPYKILCIGDSLSGQTADLGAYKFGYREDGTFTGSWPFIIRERLRLAGIDARIINLGIGGTSSPEWDFLINSGRIDGLKADVIFCSMGMNDATTNAYLSSASGTANDGIYKKALKNYVRAYFRNNPNGTFIFNQTPATDEATRLTVVSGNALYNGLTRLAAYRAEMIAAVADLKATTDFANKTILIARTDLAYDTTSTNFIYPATAGTNIHGNTQLGQPAYAQKAWETLITADFYKNNLPS